MVWNAGTPGGTIQVRDLTPLPPWPGACLHGKKILAKSDTLAISSHTGSSGSTRMEARLPVRGGVGAQLRRPHSSTRVGI